MDTRLLIFCPIRLVKLALPELQNTNFLLSVLKYAA